MLADQRKQIILDQVNLNHSVTVARLVELLGVSTETVRRDLEDLENNKNDSVTSGEGVPQRCGRREMAQATV